MRGCLLLVFFVASAWAEFDIECPFPEGQDVSSETECNKYSACEWDGAGCYMLDNGLTGYTVASEPVTTERGFTVNLQLTDNTKTLFMGDVNNLRFEVIYHEDYHVQIKVSDADNPRYEVPFSLNVPDVAGTEPAYEVVISGVGEPFQFSVTRTATGTQVFSTYGALTYENQFIQLTTTLASTYLYGFGENTHYNLRHQFEPRNTWPIFARDQAVMTGFINEYGHHPYYSVVEDDDGNTHSVLQYNSNAMEYSTFLLPTGTPALTLRTIGGIIDLHILLGPTPEDVNVQYANLVGYPEFPPYWALGFHLSRFGYNSTNAVREVRQRMKDAGIPQDLQSCDIDYMDRYRDFTYDPVNWADLPQLITELHADNVKVMLILDPPLVIDWDSGNYLPATRGREADAFVKWMSPDLVPADQPEGANDYMVGYLWPDGKTVFPDFFKQQAIDWWISEVTTWYQNMTIDMIWLDMNEPANFGTDTEKPWNWPEGQDPWSLKCPDNELDSPPYTTMMNRVGNTESMRISDHSICMSAQLTDGTSNYSMYDVHSMYGLAETKATYEAMEQSEPNMRHFILSRSTFVGSGRYTAHWQGDNSADWELLKMSIVGLIEFNMFAIPMVGSDICGFYGVPTEELCARWMELGAFYPFSRNHNNRDNPDQDPTVWPLVAAVSKDVLNLRYKYIPYLYSLFHRAHMDGNSVIRPLYNEFPKDLTARDVDDQFMWGSSLMIAPVITESAISRDVYFPEGLWYDLVSGALEASSAGSLTVSAPIEKIPVYVRGGSLVINQAPALTTVESRKNPLGLTIALDSSMHSKGELFWDDGQSLHVMGESYMAKFMFMDGVLTSSIKHGQQLMESLYLDNFVIYGYPNEPNNIFVNDYYNATVIDWSYDSSLSLLRVNVMAPLDEDLSITFE